MSRITLGACLVLGWLFLWGDVGVGPVLGGALVAAAMFVVFPSSRAIRPHVVVHPVAVGALVVSFVRDLVVSNVLLSRELLRVRTRLRSSVVEVRMHTTSPSLLTTVTNLAALTPGTMVVGADDTVPSITVHVLMFDGSGDPTPAVRSLHRLERRSVLAFGTDDAIAEYHERIAADPEATEVTV